MLTGSMQREDWWLLKLVKRDEEGRKSSFKIDDHEVLNLNRRTYVPDVDNLRQEVLTERYKTKLSIHPRIHKMYKDIKCTLWWTSMKKDISIYISRCDNCQRIKSN